MPTNKIRVLDLFCGAGGLSYGFQKNPSFEIILGIDKSQIAIDTYNRNFEHFGICRDLTTYLPQDLVHEYNIHDIDVIIGGPPCQSFSIAGKRTIGDQRDTLFQHYIQYLNYFKPRMFLIENVVGILSKKDINGNKIFDNIIEQLSVLYNVTHFKLDASYFEVPQMRKRVFIVGLLKEYNRVPSVLTPIHDSRMVCKSILLEQENVDEKYYLSARAINGIKQKKESMRKKGFGFGAQIIDPNKPCYTIPARYWKDGYDALVQYSSDKIRRLTELELKRIQTFPDNYIFLGTKKEIIIQIGNAVPCMLAFHLSNYVKIELS